MGEKYIRTPNVKCAVCEKLVYRRPVELQISNGKAYCGQICYGLSQRKETPCAVCKIPILASKHAKTCSRACANKYRTGIKYKLGRPKKDKVQNQRALKLRLIQERGTKCERCGYSKIEILQVHHCDRDRNNNELKNLELICPNCHYEEHYLEKSWLNASLVSEASDSGSFQRT
ncbi:HNH endonuclease [Candidatus Kaiserbacteria bacterium]|nr:HNH endonuclease [Candidatus Kaiserbacteria bacterium]